MERGLVVLRGVLDHRRVGRILQRLLPVRRRSKLAYFRVPLYAEFARSLDHLLLGTLAGGLPERRELEDRAPNLGGDGRAVRRARSRGGHAHHRSPRSPPPFATCHHRWPGAQLRVDDGRGHGGSRLTCEDARTRNLWCSRESFRRVEGPSACARERVWLRIDLYFWLSATREEPSTSQLFNTSSSATHLSHNAQSRLRETPEALVDSRAINRISSTARRSSRGETRQSQSEGGRFDTRARTFLFPRRSNEKEA